MAKDDPPVCQVYSTSLSIKHIFEECRKYQKNREELNISHDIGESLGPNPENETKTINFFKQSQILKLL